MPKRNNGKSAPHGSKCLSSLERMATAVVAIGIQPAGHTISELGDAADVSDRTMRRRAGKMVSAGLWERAQAKRMGINGPYKVSVYREVEK